ncbi:hypothetical protein [Aquaspirillum soli]|jgi:hypothetical protein
MFEVGQVLVDALCLFALRRCIPFGWWMRYAYSPHTSIRVEIIVARPLNKNPFK